MRDKYLFVNLLEVFLILFLFFLILVKPQPWQMMCGEAVEKKMEKCEPNDARQFHPLKNHRHKNRELPWMLPLCHALLHMICFLFRVHNLFFQNIFYTYQTTFLPNPARQ